MHTHYINKITNVSKNLPYFTVSVACFPDSAALPIAEMLAVVLEIMEAR